MARLQPARRGLLARDHLTQRALRAAITAALAPALQAAGSRGRGSRVDVAAPLTVVDVGCGRRPYASLFGNAQVIGIDMDAIGSSPDLVADALHLPLRDGCADLVFSSQVLEHVPDPQRMVAQCCRLLAPGGVLLLTAPFYWPLHEEPHDYHRFTGHGLTTLMLANGLQQVSVAADCGALTQVAVSIIELLPRWALPLMPVINLLTPALQRLSNNRKSTLNYVAWGQRGS
jgi:SAM-dependent methyltransferase